VYLWIIHEIFISSKAQLIQFTNKVSMLQTLISVHLTPESSCLKLIIPVGTSWWHMCRLYIIPKPWMRCGAPYHRSLILDRLVVEDSYAPYHRSLWTGCRGGFIARDLWCYTPNRIYISILPPMLLDPSLSVVTIIGRQETPAFCSTQSPCSYILRFTRVFTIRLQHDKCWNALDPVTTRPRLS
jgi:hypothetical protein